MSKLRITEIFHSLQGEGLSTGQPTVFVRLTGCPLRCRYCDTAYAFKGGEWMSLDAIRQGVADFATPSVLVTGGEPLAQTACTELLALLCDEGHQVSLETSGAIDLGGVDPRVAVVMDLKTPASGEMEKNVESNIERLGEGDQIKFVICDREDYLWSVDKVRELALADRCTVLFSPAHSELTPRDLAEWILEDRLPVRFQIQLHKLLWGDEQGR
ncbi:MAG TPA: 7-carboxy-7-deazaguanine synthase QueE [Chromatiales bacterium]|nr:7-carboxy-7-deazaguanine synthase QueE [Chromatiales bacterium]